MVSTIYLALFEICRYFCAQIKIFALVEHAHCWCSSVLVSPTREKKRRKTLGRLNVLNIILVDTHILERVFCPTYKVAVIDFCSLSKRDISAGCGILQVNRGISQHYAGGKKHANNTVCNGTQHINQYK